MLGKSKEDRMRKRQRDEFKDALKEYEEDHRTMQELRGGCGRRPERPRYRLSERELDDTE